MATKTAQLITEDDIEDVFEVIKEKEEKEQETDAQRKTREFIEMMDGADATATINVQRQTGGGNSPMELVGNYPADKYTYFQLQDMLQREYGGGDYRVRIYSGGRIRANQLMVIARKIDTGISKSGNPDFDRLLSIVERQGTRIEQLAQGGTGVEPQSRREFLEEMALYKDLFSQPQQTSTNQLKDMLATMAAVKEMSGMFSDGGGGEPNFGSLANMVTSMIENVNKSQHQIPIQQTPPKIRQNPHELKRPLEPTQQELDSIKMEQEKFSKSKIDKINIEKQRELDNEEMMKKLLENSMVKAGIQMLVSAARGENDPGAYVQMLLDQLPEEKLKEFLLRPDSITHLITINSQVGEHKEWFMELIEHIKGALGMRESKYYDEWNDDNDDSLTVVADSAKITVDNCENGAKCETIQNNTDTKR